VSWHSTQETVFASVGDDKLLLIWDTRDPDRSRPKHRVEAHDKEILAVAFSPSSEFLLITGSGDKTVGLFDTRSLSQRLHSFEHHTDEVLQLAWSPCAPTVFASASADRRINIWDISKIGEEQTPDDSEDGPPELMFVHGGHTGRPTDLGWGPGDAFDGESGEGEGVGKLSGWEVVSAAEDNVVMVWSMSSNIWAGDAKTVDEDELEIQMQTDD